MIYSLKGNWCWRLCCVVLLIFGVFWAESSASANTDNAVGLKFGRETLPLVLLTGQKNVAFSVSGLRKMDKLRNVNESEISFWINIAQRWIPLQKISGKSWTLRCAGSIGQAGWADIVVRVGSKEICRQKKALRIIDKFRVTLTFDDGPGLDKNSVGCDITTSPTVRVLEGLDNFVHGSGGCKRGIKAAFFVLSTPDEFCKIVYPKADTAQGKVILQEISKRGHVLGVHDGGEYRTQFNSHDKRALQPAYAVDGMPADCFANALEADLYECVGTITAETGQIPEFVRPPLWRYMSKSDPRVGSLVRKAYARYGLKMILTDAKFPDGGYYMISIASFQKYGKFRKNLRKAFLSGEDNLIISMHDSNRFTANAIGRVLKIIVAEFSRIEFGGQRADPGWRLDFADTAEQVRTNLSGKKRFVMFPEFEEGVE